MKITSLVIAGLIAAVGAVAFTAQAAEPKAQTVVAIHQNKAGLTGKTIKVEGNVVKVNNNIMGRNFVHVQDGTGKADAGNNNLIVTSKQIANVGDKVVISGVVVVNRDFGSGYSYPLLIEEASITPKK